MPLTTSDAPRGTAHRRVPTRLAHAVTAAVLLDEGVAARLDAREER